MSTRWKPTTGSFSKALPDSISINYSDNGSSNCSNQCPLKASGECYGIAVEKTKPSVKVSGERKRLAGFEACNVEYKKQLEKHTQLPWIRFSSFGSVPNRALSQREAESFKALVFHAHQLGPIHFPVESQAKRERFEQLVPDGVMVRESAHSLRRASNLAKKGIPNSVVFTEGTTKRERLSRAKIWAKKQRMKGLKVAVCPAIAATIEKRKDVKCGACTLCSKFPGTIIYPQH